MNTERMWIGQFSIYYFYVQVAINCVYDIEIIKDHAVKVVGGVDKKKKIGKWDVMLENNHFSVPISI